MPIQAPAPSEGVARGTYDAPVGTVGDPVPRLLEQGVLIPRPDLVSIDRSVDPGRIEAGAEILPGARIEGARTPIGRASRIGSAGPAHVRNCAIGRDVDLASGTFDGAVFLDGASFGPSAQAR